MRRRRRHGLTLMELLMVIGLSGLFLNLVAELFHGTMQSTFDSQTIENQASRADAAITAMRQDAWQADGIKIASDGQSAELNLSSGSAVTWRVLTNGTIEREMAGLSTHWNIARPDWRFRADPTALWIIQVDHGDTHELPLVSQILLARRLP